MGRGLWCPYGAAALELMGSLCVCPSDLSKSMAARQKLEAQLTENNIVKEVSAPCSPTLYSPSLPRPSPPLVLLPHRSWGCWM